MCMIGNSFSFLWISFAYLNKKSDCSFCWFKSIIWCCLFHFFVPPSFGHYYLYDKTLLFVHWIVNSFLLPTYYIFDIDWMLQEEYNEGEEVGRMKCEHQYHVCCIHEWLRQKNWCPICKASAIPADTDKGNTWSCLTSIWIYRETVRHCRCRLSSLPTCEYMVFPPFQNIRCFRFVKQMYVNIF
jgi:hypothetical protein